MAEKVVDVSVILPCLNEVKTIGICIKKAQQVFKENKIKGEIIVVIDERCIDKSDEIAKKLGAIVLTANKGYGAAYIKGFSVAKGRAVVMADSDDTYNILEMPKLLAELKNYDTVIGSRFTGEIKEGAMSWSHRYVGNPLLTWILNVFFKLKVSDAHSGFRAFRKEALSRLDLHATGMEFASELIVKSARASLKVKEVPITYNPRAGESKLNSFRDGWKHLRFMLLYSPMFLFLVPGALLFLSGLILMTLLLAGPVHVGAITLDIHPMIVGALLTIVGFQIITLGVYAKTYAIKMGLDKPSGFMRFIEKYANFERGILAGLIIGAIGLILDISILREWIDVGFGALSELRTAIFALTLVIIAVQVMFSAFFLGVLGIEKR
jgi:glycosyltransferase involved in cell wall biosynthesis